MNELVVSALCGSALGYLVPSFFRRTIGTRYRTEKDCKTCEMRQAVQEIRTLVVELAIKAGVPAQEVAKLVRRIN